MLRHHVPNRICNIRFWGLTVYCNRYIACCLSIKQRNSRQWGITIKILHNHGLVK